MLDSVSFNNFRGLDNITVPLSQFTMLTGSNGIGKTSALEGLYCLFSQTKLDVSPLTRYRRAVGLLPDQTGLSMKQTYNYKLFWDECPNYGIGKCSVEAKSGESVWEWSYRKAYRAELQDISGIKTIAADDSTEFAHWVWTYKENSSITRVEKLGRVQALSPDGGLYLFPNAFYHDKSKTRFDSACAYIDFPLIQNKLANLPLQIAKLLTIVLKFFNPHVTDIRLSGINNGLSVVLDNEREVSLSSLGNGATTWVSTMAMILGVISRYPDDYKPKDPTIILIDEMGAGVHYSIMLDMWKFLKNLSEKYPFIQFVFTSHSDDCIKAYCEAFAETDQASIVRMHKIFDSQEIITTEYKRELFTNVTDGDWEIRG